MGSMGVMGMAIRRVLGVTMVLMTCLHGVASSAAHVTANTTDPQSSTQALLDTLKSIKTAPDSHTALPEADRKANRSAFGAIDGYFNFDRLTRDPIEPHARHLTVAQRKRFDTTFRELIRLVAYPQAGSFLRSAKVTVKPGTVSGKVGSVPMHAYLAEEDLDTTAVFRWEKGAKGWQIVDVSFDGASLVKDYQNQFGRILDKEGPDGLLRKLEERLLSERKSPSVAI